MKLENTRHIHKNEALINSFIDVIVSYVSCIQNSSQELHKSLKGGLDMALRILTGSHSSFVSEKVLDHLCNNKIDVNPFDLKWEERHQMGHVIINNREHAMAVWEHTIPIKEFRESLICLKDKNLIVKTIHEYSGVAWISREEDIQLTKLGFQSKRPQGFLKCYEKAGIKLLNEYSYNK